MIQKLTEFNNSCKSAGVSPGGICLASLQESSADIHPDVDDDGVEDKDFPADLAIVDKLHSSALGGIAIAADHASMVTKNNTPFFVTKQTKLHFKFNIKLAGCIF